jgi:16S rRNA C967 or C1407 C5-methylase (RsmB/RsmF family)
MMVVNHHAQYFPTLWESKNEKGPEGNQKFYFDKILADVPCSGDGAIRKIPSKWQKWTPKDGTALHSLQLQILMRAV